MRHRMFKQSCIATFFIFAAIMAQDDTIEQCKIDITFSLDGQTRKTIPALFIFSRKSNVPSLKALCASIINKHTIDQNKQKMLPKYIALQIDQQKEGVMNCFGQIIKYIITQNRKPKELKESLYHAQLFDHINLKNLNLLQAHVYIKQNKQYALLNLNFKRDPSTHWIPQVSIEPVKSSSYLQKELIHIWHMSKEGGMILTHDHVAPNKKLEPEQSADDGFGIESECIIL